MRPDGEEGAQPQHVHADDIDSAKGLLRRAVLLRRDLRPEADRRSDDAHRFALVRQRIESDDVSTVAAYLSAGSEPGTLQLIGWLAARGVRVLLPVLTTGDGKLRREGAWAAYDGPDALRVGRTSILEPTTPTQPGDALAEADLVVCPALAANTVGDRLGRGGGWYDRVLSHARESARIWALLNDDEVLAAIPTQPWDRRVTAIATPSRIIDCRPESSLPVA